MYITEGELFNTLYGIVNNILNGNYVEEYTMDYSKSGHRDCSIYNKLTKVYKSSVVLCRTNTNIRFIHYKRNWNIYISQYNKKGFGELYIKYNGAMYYYQPTMVNNWGCIFRKNCASVPEERSAIPLQTEQSSAG